MNMMQAFPLTVDRIIDHAAKYHANREILSRSIEGPITRTTWKESRDKSLLFAQALVGMGVKKGDVIGVMAWNTARHMEVWFGLPGAGAVNHTLNPRLSIDQLIYIINHAGDKILVVDFDLLPLIAAVWDKLETVEHVIVMTIGTICPTALFQTLSVTRICWPNRMETSTGCLWMKTTPADFVILLEQPATRKGWFIRTDRTLCMPCPAPFPI